MCFYSDHCVATALSHNGAFSKHIILRMNTGGPEVKLFAGKNVKNLASVATSVND